MVLQLAIHLHLKTDCYPSDNREMDDSLLFSGVRNSSDGTFSPQGCFIESEYDSML